LDLPTEKVETPYSLGKLIDWKLRFIRHVPLDEVPNPTTPYSLGKLIDWKLTNVLTLTSDLPLPTR
jgi:hypothetical protein